MRHKILILAVLLAADISLAQSINFRFNNYFYGWQRLDSLSDNSSAKTTHLRGYQNYLLEFNSGKWSFNTLAQTEEDLINRVGRGFHYRFYNLYIKGTNLFNMLDVKLGRQYVYAGTGNGTLDGLHLRFKAGKNKEYQLALYGGALAPYTYDFGKYPEIKNNYHFGAQFTYYGVRDLMAAVSYSNKKLTPEPYTALRMDSLFNLYDRTVSFDGPSEQLIGADVNYTYLGKHNVYGKAYYDIGQNKFYRGEVNARITLKDNIRLFAEYTYREPHFVYNSIFWVFAYSKNQEIDGGLDYTFKNGINVFGRIGAVFYENDNSIKLQGGVTHPNFGVSFTRYSGYSGESDGVNAYGQKDIYKQILSASASVSYANYRLGNVYATDKVNSFSGMLGFTYRPVPQFSVDGQGQFLINRIYKADTRFLVGFTYWLFKKLGSR